MTLIILLVVTSLSCEAQANADIAPTSEDGMSQADLARVEDAPEGCVRNDEIILPSGQSLYEHQKAKGDIAATAADKKLQDRLDSISKPSAVGGEDFGAPAPESRRLTSTMISLYDKPGGRVLGTFPKNFAVGITGQKDDWVLVQGYWSRCFERGWTRKKFLVKKTVDELKALGIYSK